MEKFNLKEFLVGEETNVSYRNDDDCIVLAKMESTKKEIVYLFMQSSYRTELVILNPRDLTGDLIGIYNKKTNKLITMGSWSYRSRIMEADTQDIEIIGDTEFENMIARKVNENIKSKVKGKKENVSVSEDKIREIESNSENRKKYYNCLAIEEFLYGKAIERECNYAFYKLGFHSGVEKNKWETIFNFILNFEETIESKAEWFINKYSGAIYEMLLTKELIEKEVEIIKNDREMIICKKIAEIFSDREKKSFAIKYEEDGVEMTFKIANPYRLNGQNYINCYNMVNRNERNKFERTYKGRKGEREIYFENIKEITYSRKTLYKKD